MLYTRLMVSTSTLLSQINVVRTFKMSIPSEAENRANSCNSEQADHDALCDQEL